MEPSYDLTDDHAASHLTDKQRLAVDCIVPEFARGGQGDWGSKEDRVQVRKNNPAFIAVLNRRRMVL